MNHLARHTMLASLSAAMLLVSLPSQADVSGNLGITSNYLWRGVSQTQDKAAVQGGLDYSHQSGFYAGSWASNVDFNDGTSYELDLYAGFSTDLGQDISIDAGYLYYGYPDADGSISFGELYGAITWRWLTLGYAGFIHAGDDVAATGLDDKDYRYLTADIDIPLSDTLSLALHYGHNSGDVIQSWFGEQNYSDYHLALTAATKMGDVSFMLADTNLSGDDTKVVLGYSFSFDL